MEKPVINFEIAGQSHTFEYGLTECHVYRNVSDNLYSHIEAIEHGTQRIYVFNCPRQISFLTGMQLFPHEDMSKKEVKDLTTAMENTVGWEAELRIMDEAPEEIKERYIRLSTVALRSEVVTIPGDWK